MAILLPSAARARHDYFDRTMAEATSMLQDPAVAAALGERVLQSFEPIFDRYYVPNVRHNVVELPQAGPRAEEGIPVIPLKKRHEFVMPPQPKPFHPFQLARIGHNLRAMGFSVEDAHTVGSQIATMNLQSPMIVKLGDRHVGNTGALRAEVDFKHPRLAQPVALELNGSPFVALHMKPRTSRFEGASNFLHESQHVVQYMAQPIAKADDATELEYRCELESTYVQSTILRALYSKSSNPMYRGNEIFMQSRAHDLEQMRQRETASLTNKLQPTPKIMQYMRDEDYIATTI